jgi:amino acid adenylation domain-containing protein
MENLHALLTAPAATTPDKPAVLELGADGHLSAVSYRELTVLAGCYAAVLGELGLSIGDRVVIRSATSAAAVAMILACSALGLPFVPVGPEAPARMLRVIVDAVEPALVAQPRLPAPREPLRDALGEPLPEAVFDRDGMAVDRLPTRRRDRYRQVIATDTAYIIFTSGTSGQPKGVVMSHRAVTALLRAVVGDGLVSADDRIASASPLHFDFALFDIGTALGGGATLVPIPRSRLSSPRRLVALLDDTGSTQVNGVPSIWSPVLRHDPGLLTTLPLLRRVVFAGEEFPLPELRKLQEMLPGVTAVNGYGATESMACSFTPVPNPLPADAERLCIGAVHSGAELVLVSDHGRVIEEPGVTGELYLRSPALFTGYWDDQEATRAVLVPDPLEPRSGAVVLRTGDLALRGEDGGLYFCGRADSRVQIRGNRVELGEVESALTRHPGVSASVAKMAARSGGDRTLIAFVTLADPLAAFDEAAALAFCKRELPAYMVPRVIRPVPAFPLTTNGKVDRDRLADDPV